MMRADFSACQEVAEPFPNIRAQGVVSPAIADETLAWLETGAPWRLKQTDFYEQYEFSLLADAPPPALADLTSTAFVDSIAAKLESSLGAASLGLVDVTAHRLSEGQTIRVHNDFIEFEETHRFLIQLNRGWTADRGGYLMLFESDGPGSATEILLPEHRTAFGFEISPKSYHAVSTVRSGERYTLVYTFRDTP